MSLINTIVAMFVTKTTEAQSSPVNLYRYQAVAVAVYGEIEGRTVAMDIGMPVKPFQRWNACQTFPDAQSAAKLARSYSKQEFQYAVTKDGVIIALYWAGALRKTSIAMGNAY
jgi:hypothetical protein